MPKWTMSQELEHLLTRARQEALLLGHSQVGSEHLLLALLQQQAPGTWALTVCGWDGEGFRRLISRQRGATGGPLPQGLSFGARSALAGAAREAMLQKDGRIRPEHLLLSLLRQEQTTAVRLLREGGTRPEEVFSQLMEERDFTPRHPKEERGLPMRLLEQFCTDLVVNGPDQDPVVGRDQEIDAVIAILSRKNKNNPALIGEPGVGKTAIVEGLAQRMAAGQVPEELQNKRLLSVDMASVLAGTKYRGEFEERVRDMVAEVRRCGNVILFIDEMHTIVGAGSAEGAIDASNLLKPALSRGEIQLIGATTLEEYRKHIEKDGALERRFRPVMVREPDRDRALAMLEGLRPGLEKHHQIRMTREALEAAVDLSIRYLTDRFLPDKAVDLLDEAAARVRNRQFVSQGTEESRRQLNRELSQAVREDRFEQAASLRDRLQQLARQQRSVLRKVAVEPSDIAETVSQRTGIPVGSLTRSDRDRLLHLEQELSGRVLGQGEAVRAVAQAVSRGRLGLADGARPVASMLFLGPTGVGKTELCKALADCVYGSRDALIRLDMSEYMEQHAVSRLLGAPPGYVGHGEGGELTEKVRRRPWSVVLLDELEKAHRDVTAILLQVLEDGVLTDSMGRHVDFRNTIVVMTSNLGSGRKALDRVGFGEEGPSDPGRKALEALYSPEFLGRLDCVTTFRPLSRETLEAIARKELKAAADRAGTAGAELELHPQVAPWMAGRCVGGKAGARELRRMIRRELESPLAQRLLEAEGQVQVQVTVEKDGLLLKDGPL